MARSLSVGTVSSHGVRQVCPCEVRASAPGGSDSIRNTSVGGLDLKKSKLGMDIEQSASASPQATAAITRLMLLMVIPTIEAGPLPSRPPRYPRTSPLGRPYGRRAPGATWAPPG